MSRMFFRSSMRGRVLAGAVVLCAGAAWALSAIGPKNDLRVLWHEDRNYVALKSLASAYGSELSVAPSGVITIENKWNQLVFRRDSRELLVNNTLVWMHEPVISVRGRWVIRQADAQVVIDPLLRPERYLAGLNYRVVVLDAGHGGQDNGTRGPRLVVEKKLVLDIARRVRTHLSNAGLKVYMTREGDRFVELDERCRKAQRWGGHVFVSIHLNSAGSADANGVETYALASTGLSSTGGGEAAEALPGNSFEAGNSALAFQVHKALCVKAGAVDRGVKRARFLVLRNAPCPAALVECGFLSNKAEEEKLLTEDYRERVAEGIARGIVNYANLIRRAKLAEPGGDEGPR
jgi:N-acetylmuramoyl-L-alanine amidase